MLNKGTQDDSPLMAIKNESTRQRWELFHRAIAHAKQSNVSAMQEAAAVASEIRHPGPPLSMND